MTEVSGGPTQTAIGPPEDLPLPPPGPLQHPVEAGPSSSSPALEFSLASQAQIRQSHSLPWIALQVAIVFRIERG